MEDQFDLLNTATAEIEAPPPFDDDAFFEETGDRAGIPESATAQAPKEAGPTAENSAKAFIVLLDSLLRRGAAMYGGGDPKRYAMEPEEKEELTNVWALYFQQTGKEIPPGAMAAIATLIISASIFARAHADRKRDQAAKAQAEKARQAIREREAAQAEADEAARIAAANLIESAATAARLPDFRVAEVGGFPIDNRRAADNIKAITTKATKEEKRTKFGVDKDGYYYFGHSEKDPKGVSGYRDKENPGTWVKAPDVVLALWEKVKAEHGGKKASAQNAIVSQAAAAANVD